MFKFVQLLQRLQRIQAKFFLVYEATWIRDEGIGGKRWSPSRGWATECESFPPAWALGVNFQRGSEVLGKSLKFAWQPTQWNEWKRREGDRGWPRRISLGSTWITNLMVTLEVRQHVEMKVYKLMAFHAAN